MDIALPMLCDSVQVTIQHVFSPITISPSTYAAGTLECQYAGVSKEELASTCTARRRHLQVQFGRKVSRTVADASVRLESVTLPANLDTILL